MLWSDNWLFFVGLRSSCIHTFFRSSIPLKAVKKIIKSKIFKIIWAHSPNTRKESVHTLRIRGMNLFVYRDDAERICTYTENMRNQVNLRTEFRCLYTENTWNWICLYTENTRNESVRILRIHGMDMYTYWEYTECTKNQISQQISPQNQNIFGSLSGAQMGSFLPNHLKPKNLMQVYL